MSMQIQMQVNWSKLAAEVMVWLASECLLNLVGLDHLANYGEFVFGHSTTPQLSLRAATGLVIIPPVNPLTFLEWV